MDSPDKITPIKHFLTHPGTFTPAIAKIGEKSIFLKKKNQRFLYMCSVAVNIHGMVVVDLVAIRSKTPEASTSKTPSFGLKTGK